MTSSLVAERSPVHAQLISSGLVYSCNEAYAAMAGVVGFVPQSELITLLRGPEQGLIEMELAGLEAATSWVR